VRRTLLFLFLTIALQIGAPAARAEFIADVSVSGTRSSDTVTLSVNAVEILTLGYSSTNHAVLANLANAMTRQVRSSSDNTFTPQSVRVANSILIITLTASSEYKIPVAEILRPNVPEKQLAGAVLNRLQEALKHPPFALIPSKLTIPMGESRTARFTGAYGADIEVLNSYPETVDVEINGSGIIVSGLAEGDGQVILRAGTKETVLSFTVRKLAAYLPESLRLEIAGDAPSRDDLLDAMKVQLSASASVAPDATIEFTDISQAPDGSGWSAKISADAPSRIKVSRSIPIKVERGANYREQAQSVLFSNDPEQVYHAGLLYSTNLVNGDRTRLAYHHQNRSGKKLRFRVVLVNLSDSLERVFWRAGNAGPDISTFMVGSVAVEKYLRKYNAGQGVYLSLAPHAETTVFQKTAGPDQSVSGLMDLHLLSRGEVGVLVVAEDTSSPLRGEYMASSASSVSSSAYPPRYQPAVATRTESYDLDGNWLFLRVGRGETFDHRGRPLIGDYGLLLEYEISLVNGVGHSRQVVVSFDATAGEARAVFLIDGDLVRTPNIRPRDPYVLKTLTLAPYETRELEILTIPAGGSHFPANIIIAAQD
jgi:hypothetical protein